MQQEWFPYDILTQSLPPLAETAAKVTADMVFNGMYMDSINPTCLFLARFNRVPNLTHEKGINCSKALDWLKENYAAEWKDFHYAKLKLGNHAGNPRLEDFFVYLFEDLLIWFDFSADMVRFLFRDTHPSQVDEIIRGVRRFRRKRPVNKGRICVLVNASDGLELKVLTTHKPRLSVHDNYNDDFQEVHRNILKRLGHQGKGLVILHGKPGTGKTSYIRYLATMVRKRVIFIPPGMAGAITNPGLIELLIDNPNSLLVIEDAEQLVISRDASRHSPVSAILNITDGLLSDCLNIQVICSFNTDISRIDPALLRKGRLIAQYEFKELSAKKARGLSTKLGFQTDIHTPKNLAAIYNQSDPDYIPDESRPKIGFTSRNPSPSDDLNLTPRPPLLRGEGG
jgi:hypothetical protein